MNEVDEAIDRAKKMNAKMSFGGGRSGASSAMDEDASGKKPSGVSNKSREKKVKGPQARRKRKRRES